MTTNAYYALHPRSIALIGVSGEGVQYGAGTVFQNLRKYGYTGKLYPVNPKYEDIEGFKCYSSVKDIGEEIDMVVIGIAAKNVPNLLRECGEAGAKSAIILSSGFAEVSGGQALQQEIIDICAAYGIRVVGPNCSGLVNSVENIVATTSTGVSSLDNISKGKIGCISQSGAMISSLSPVAENSKMGYSYLISSGNEADLKLADYIELFLEDLDTNVISAYVEGLKELPRLAELAEKAVEIDKPFIVFKPGKSERAQASVAAHTGSLVGSDQIVNSFFKQHGIIRLDDVNEIFESGYLLTKPQRMPGNHVAVITTSGGAGSIICDVCDEEGLVVSELSAVTQEKLHGLLPAFASTINPVDLTAEVLKLLDRLGAILKVVENDSDISALIMTLVGWPHGPARILAQKIVEYYSECTKPFIMIWYTSENNREEIDFLKEAGVPLYLDYRSGVKALKRVYEWSQMMANKPRRTQIRQKADAIVPSKVADYIKITLGQTVLTETQGKELFGKLGLSVAKGQVVASPDAAVAVATEIGYPVVLKVVSEEITHKSDIGGVKINMKNAEEVRNAFAEIEQAVAATGKKYDGILVEQMISGGIEVIAGITTDAQFGPVVVFGSGGIYTEVYKDASMRVCPIDKNDALEMIQETKVYKILQGVRGQGPYDIDALADTLVKLSDFGFGFQERVKEVDINPLIVREKGKGVVIADTLVISKFVDDPARIKIKGE